jgi:uncharacterized membrane protein
MYRAFLQGLMSALFLALPYTAMAGGYGNGYGAAYCNTCVKSVAVAPVVASKSYNVQFAASTVYFVPTTVALGGTVTVYDPSLQSVGYTYAGPPVQGAQYNQVQNAVPNAAAVAPTGSGVSSAASAPATGDAVQMEQLKQQIALLQAMLEGNKVGMAAADFQVQSVLKEACIKCHAAGGSGVLVDAPADVWNRVMFDTNGNLLPELPWFNIYSAIDKNPGDAGFMPQGAKAKMEDAKREIVRLHLNKKLVNKKF